MTSRAFVSPMMLFVAFVACPLPAAAHRLDEYLQATRLAIDVDRIEVEIDLTAGVGIAPRIAESIDTDGDGRISAAEGETYARRVLSDVVLTVDGRRAPVSLLECRFPDAGEMMLGVGLIRVRGSAGLPAAGAGSHHASYLNGHRPEASVYLANALVPSDRRLQIDGQRRDVAQRGLTIDYRFEPDARADRGWWLAVGLTMAIGLAAVRRRPTPLATRGWDRHASRDARA
jgi:nickel/cobalt transporter (NicO) family protein